MTEPELKSCCAPPTGRAARAVEVDAVETCDPPRRAGDLVRLDGGEFLMGSEDAHAYPGDGEGPVRAVRLEAFRISRTAVSNVEFGEFVAATGYRTEAERWGWSFVFAGLLPDDFPPTRGVAATPWWRQVEGADWRHPEGPGSDVDERGDHPVVHVSWSDARAYCAWAGLRLPTEAEWEYAARGGLAGRAFPWGDELEPGGRHLMNVWQGEFPRRNTRADGWLGTCPVDAFPPNGFGLHNTTGNAWEWCADWFDPGHRTRRSARGGSYLCHDSYCRRYRVSARQGLTPDSTTGNTGFRCALDA
ncbi:formylglycine-generating enzyme family protein [Saccharopolyspora erythraea]|uniref:formylglycine-generating enzyme family protein n=1 Tax=Saccharopolyspora erythraea TaxID=1836 RepID=UPI001BF0CA53|nr:formylglycine-generating enzyme family protein [Saccharopolyspora erythraea]QUH03386.1 formylglycine-generating enzyme family protein [Saccharopolyspora erythraea]